MEQGAFMKFEHDSTCLAHRSPFGAQRTDQTVFLYADTDGQAQRVELVTYWQEEQRRYDCQEQPLEGGLRWCTALTLPDTPGLLFYHFEAHVQGHTYKLYAPQDGLGGRGDVREQPAVNWQITVYDGPEVPGWMSHSIMYQIFPDRYCNGNADGEVYHVPKGGLLHAHWNDVPYYVRDKDGSVVHWDFFGGNLQGVLRHLDDLAELGVNVLYFNPLFEAASNHKYDTGDYRRIDPMFGTVEDFELLVEEAHERGIRIILDGVFSHTGSDSRYFNREGHYDEVGAYQSPDSPYASWYQFTHFPDQYDCWWGFVGMPNTKELDPSYLDYQVTGENSTVRQWMRRGIDGWRLDVADELPDAFLTQLKQVVRQENPEALLLGEVWEDASNKVAYGVRRQYFWGQSLDSVTNYPFRVAMLDFLTGIQGGYATYRRMMSLYENYPRGQFYALMNMTGSHDTARLLTQLAQAPDPEGMSEFQRGQYRLSPEQLLLGVTRVKLYALLQFTHPGMPCIYYGDEVGMQGYADPYNRGPYPWGRENEDLRDYFRWLAKERRQSPELTEGDYRPLSPCETVYGHLRTLEGVASLVLVNAGNAPQTAVVYFPELYGWRGEDRIHGAAYTVGDWGRIEAHLAARSAVWIRFEMVKEEGICQP